VKRTVNTDEAPAAVGAYSQATVANGLVFVSGQLPLTTSGELLEDEPIEEQTRQSLENVGEVLAAENLDMEDVVKTTIFLDDIDEFDAMNGVYSDFFTETPPARSAVEAGNVPKGAGVEIEAIAVCDASESDSSSNRMD
jgi:2-iminobutanoate/2-iminopropanoate deaminase